MAIGTAWADGAWVDASWVVGAWDQAVSPPIFSGTIPDISLEESASTTEYDLSTYFTGATSYSISPAVEAGWSFNTTTGVLTILPDTIGDFGPYTVTGTNAGGSDSSNAFAVAVTAEVVALPGGSSDPGRYKDETLAETRRRRKFYDDLAKARRARLAPPEKKQPVEPEAKLQRKKKPILRLVHPAPAPVVLPDAVAPPFDYVTEELRKAFAEDMERRRREALRLEMLRKQEEALLLLLLD